MVAFCGLPSNGPTRINSTDNHSYLIHFYNDIDQWELYDLENDPIEMDNIYDLPENKEIIESLKKELILLQEKYRDTGSLN